MIFYQKETEFGLVARRGSQSTRLWVEQLEQLTLLGVREIVTEIFNFRSQVFLIQ